MAKDDRGLLTVLKQELEFLEQGGYERYSEKRWRPVFIFEDSPTCLNYALPEKVHPCIECALMELVPEQDRNKPVPCDHIPLNEAGETVDTLNKCATQAETEEVVKTWLRATIQRLEEQRKQPAQAREPEGSKQASTPTFRCANPICPDNYITRGGGRFFRFHVEPEPLEQRNTHGVKHYWLCAHCSLVFTLAEEPGRGPALKLRWTELPEGARPKVLPAA